VNWSQYSRSGGDAPLSGSVADRHVSDGDLYVEGLIGVVVVHPLTKAGGVCLCLLSGGVESEQFGTIVVVVARGEDGVCFGHRIGSVDLASIADQEEGGGPPIGSVSQPVQEFASVDPLALQMPVILTELIEAIGTVHVGGFQSDVPGDGVVGGVSTIPEDVAERGARSVNVQAIAEGGGHRIGSVDLASVADRGPPRRR